MVIGDLEVAHRWADVNGIRLHYVEKGQGPLVVLLHGFPEMWWSWRYQIDPLARAGYRVIAPDLRGYNDSERKGPYDIDTLAADVRALIRHAGHERAIVVGHDWGGAIAWHLAGTMPEACERLCVLNCPHPSRLVEAFFQGRVRQLRRSWYMFFFLLPALPERLLTRRNAQVMHAIYRANAVDRTNFGLEEIAPFIEAVQKPGAASAMIAYYRVALSRGLRHPKRFAPQRPIRVPTLLLWGMEDKALGFDDLVPGTERQVPSLRVEKREGCGHFVQAEQPGWVNERLLAFFAEAASGIGATAS